MSKSNRSGTGATTNPAPQHSGGMDWAYEGLDGGMLARLDRMAKRHGVCRDALIREYLERGLDAKAP